MAETMASMKHLRAWNFDHAIPDDKIKQPLPIGVIAPFSRINGLIDLRISDIYLTYCLDGQEELHRSKNRYWQFMIQGSARTLETLVLTLHFTFRDSPILQDCDNTRFPALPSLQALGLTCIDADLENPIIPRLPKAIDFFG